MLTNILIRNFKQFDKVAIPLGNAFAFIGPNNSGKTTALQALALWHAGLQEWRKKAGAKRKRVTINRKDLVFIPTHHSNALWKNRKVYQGERQPARIEITVCGITNGGEWKCGLEFEYQGEETFFCRPLRKNKSGDDRMEIPDESYDISVTYIPPMSGLVRTEPLLQPGSINSLLGQGRTAEVLRNVCHTLYESDTDKWQTLAGDIKNLFGIEVQPPRYGAAYGDIELGYKKDKVAFDIQSVGRGTQQAILLLAFLLRGAQNTVFLMDEPDAHLEILKQDLFYERIQQYALGNNTQILIASHSEVILNKAAAKESAVAFIGSNPHLMSDGKKAEVLKSLTSIGWENYEKAEITGWVLFVEGETDKRILTAFAEKANHPAKAILNKGCFIRHIGSDTMSSEYGIFSALKEAVPELLGLAITDKEQKRHKPPADLTMLAWQKREIENYIFSRETLLIYADDLAKDQETPALDYRATIQAIIEKQEEALKTLGESSLFSDDGRMSERMGNLLAQFTKKMGLPPIYKADFYKFARHTPTLDKEITEKLDAIVAIAKAAKKRRR